MRNNYAIKCLLLLKVGLINIKASILALSTSNEYIGFMSCGVYIGMK